MLLRRLIGLYFSGWSLSTFMKKGTSFAFLNSAGNFSSLRHLLRSSTKYGSITGEQHLNISILIPSWLQLLLFFIFLTIFWTSSIVVGKKAIVFGLRWMWGILCCWSSNFLAKAGPMFVKCSFNMSTSRVLKLGSLSTRWIFSVEYIVFSWWFITSNLKLGLRLASLISFVTIIRMFLYCLHVSLHALSILYWSSWFLFVKWFFSLLFIQVFFTLVGFMYSSVA